MRLQLFFFLFSKWGVSYAGFIKRRRSLISQKSLITLALEKSGEEKNIE